MMTTRSAGRTRALLLLAPVLLTLVACKPPTWPVQTPYLSNADAAVAWLVSDVEAHGHLYSGGELADTVLGLAAAGADRATASPVLDRLAEEAEAFTSPGGNVDPGATAKTILAVQAAGANPNDFAGLDLEAMLRGTIRTDGADAGRFGSSNAFTQSLGVMALVRTYGGVPASSTGWLAAQQCPSGAFSWGNCNFADADHTALAATALLSRGDHAVGVAEAVDWLVDTRNPDGGWSVGGSVSNANSTGLVVPLIRSTGHTAEADQAAAFVRSLQYGADAGAKAGAIRWMPTIDSSLQMATAQGVLAWGAGPYHQLAFPSVEGEPCPDEDGVTVVVDLSRYDNTIRVACAVGPQATGWDALTNAGYSVGAVPGHEGQAICTIEGAPAGGYPECWNEGFWAYFHDATRSGSWSFSDVGAGARTPPPGSVEGWRYEPDWMHHTAAAPGISPLWGLACATPRTPVLDIVDDDEVLTFPTAWGSEPLVATFDGSAPLTAADLDTAAWTRTDSLALSGMSGPVRVVARPADPSCGLAGGLHAVYDVREAYAPRSGTPGSPAVPVASADIVAWASGHVDYQPGPNVSAGFQVPTNAYGSAVGNTSVVVLGDRGRITMTFDEPIADTAGYDLAIFENGFGIGSGPLDFLELAYVEVSSDGENFARFASASRREGTPGAFGGQLASELGGLAGKDLAGFGTPFDLSALSNHTMVRSGVLDLDSVTHVRIVDVTGDGADLDSFGRPIFDAHPTSGSGGFDLRGVAVLRSED